MLCYRCPADVVTWGGVWVVWDGGRGSWLGRWRRWWRGLVPVVDGVPDLLPARASGLSYHVQSWPHPVRRGRRGFPVQLGLRSMLYAGSSASEPSEWHFFVGNSLFLPLKGVQTGKYYCPNFRSINRLICKTCTTLEHFRSIRDTTATLLYKDCERVNIRSKEMYCFASFSMKMHEIIYIKV